jgi:LysM repeat protein
VDTLKSLAVISLLGAVLYGVYVVASKPDKPLPADMEALVNGADEPLIEGGSGISPPRIEGLPSNSTAPAERERSGPRLKLATPSSRTVSEATEERVPPKDPVTARSAVEAKEVERTSYDQNASDNSTYPINEEQPAPKKPSAVEVTSGRSSSDRDPEIEAARQRIQLYAFQMAWKTARDQVSQEKHREALLALTPFYNDPAIPAEKHQELVGWLDALAAKVIYSTEHLMEPAHEVHRGETLYRIADKYRVPYMLLKNINAVRDNDVLVPGTKLKVLSGPFQAEVSLSRQEITIFVQKLYAGRFAFTLGNEPAPPGEYLVKEKDPAKQFNSPQGTLSAKDPRNPYGGIYIDLGQGVAMHGSPGEAYADSRFGCIQLAPRDAEDLMAILSKDESTVIIRE